MAKEEKEKDTGEEEKAGNPMMKIVIIAVLASTILSGAVAGVVIFMMGGDEPEADENGEEVVEEVVLEPPVYQSMDPKFVVSFEDPEQARFMQFSVQVMTRDTEVIDSINLHMPAVRSSILLLVGNQQNASVTTREGKEELLVAIKDDINATLEGLGEKSGIESAYFTSFVIQ